MKPIPGLLEHAIRTSKIVLKVAPFLTKTKPPLLATAAFLHDIGKINWPQELHTKKGLTVIDQSMIHIHPLLGVHVVKNIWPSVPAFVLDVIEGHHERPGGNGYPHGLHQVPYDILIVAAVESYDAMTSDRPYRDNAWDHDDAIKYLVKWCPENILNVLDKRLKPGYQVSAG